jgi:tetratricopeptide (TPR) repeat protein
VRFIIAQTIYKFDPADDSLYANIASQVNNSLFILLSDRNETWAMNQIITRLEQSFVDRGLNPKQHLLVIPWQTMEKFQTLLDVCDVYLDCPSFSGYTTAWQAVHRGIPIVTLEGEFMRQRLAAGLLRKIGITDTIANSREQYVQLAVKLADESRDPIRRTTRRQALKTAAPKADNDVSVVRAFEQNVINALEIDLNSVETLINQGNKLEDLYRLEDALACYDHALSINPIYARAHSNRGNLLQSLKRFDEALQSYNRALEIRPDYAEAYYNRGNTLQTCDRFQEAILSYDLALNLKPDFIQALISRGNAQQACKRFNDALTSYQLALAIQPNYVEALYNQGRVLQDTKRYTEALASYERAITIRPNYAAAHLASSWCYLLLGDYDKGWKEYEWRWQSTDFKNSVRKFQQPQWTGEISLQGKTILLHSEQGLGDTLQFCRYTKLVAELGAKVILELPKPLSRLLTNLDGVSQLIVHGSVLPAFDFHCPLLSLPLAFKTRLESIPVKSPYLFSEPDKVKHWQTILGEKNRPRIGIVWSGNPAHKNDQNRSLSLQEMLPLLSLPYQFISLQKELRDTDKELLTQELNLYQCGEQLNDFTDTAALCELMDIIISVDTSVAHLAAAIGKPTWILLPDSPDSRWLLDREDSPWYPSVRLFRQNQQGDWQDVIERLKQELSKIL